MAQCHPSSQTFSQFIRPSSLLSYTSKTDCIINIYWASIKAMKREMNAMPALSKFLVLLAIFLSASLGDAFVNHARLNHLIWFDASMSYPTNEPSRVPSHKRTNDQTTNQRLEWNAELSNVLSSKQVKCSLLKKQDAELPSTVTVTQNTHSRGLCQDK